MTLKFDDIQKRLNELGLIQKGIHDLETRLSLAFQDSEISEAMQLQLPPIEDLSDLLDVSGKVYAIRMDKTPSTNHKHHVVAGLILMNMLTGKLKDLKQILIDGGNVNTALALKYHSERLGLSVDYMMSRLFPKDIVDMLKANNFELLQAPKNNSVRIEREFYEFALDQHRKTKSSVFLAHAKYGLVAMKYFGEQIAKTLPEIDCSISCIGAGTTLEGIQIPIKERTGANIYLGEHELSPMFPKDIPYSKSEKTLDCQEIENIRGIDLLPHSVIGPHYDEPNPFISKLSLNKVSSVITYSESDWKKMKYHLSTNGVNIGNSSAANLHLATYLAQQGKKVFTIIFEPDRPFYYI